MNKRRSVRKHDEAAVLLRSRRRCCLCAYLDGDFREKQGQIAHLSRDPSRSSPENLVFLCLDHHDRYDSGTSQSKGLTAAEVLRCREMLHEWSDQVDQHANDASRAQLRSLEMPWAFELHYVEFELMFRISPDIYKILPDHQPDDADLSRAIEDPVHASDGCYHILKVKARSDDSNVHGYLPALCNGCKQPVINTDPLNNFIHAADEDGFHVIIGIGGLKRGVFQEIRRLITIGKPLSGRIKIAEWVHPLEIAAKWA